MIRRPPRSTLLYSSAASDVYKRQVIIHKILYSENEKLLPNISKLEIQSRPEIIKPEKIVERDHVDALKDKASVLFLSDVLLIINGNEHTRITIMPIPQRINAS